MAHIKPLILIKPYSETTERLKKVFNEIAKAENFSIYEVDSMEEYRQVLRVIGPSLGVFSNARKCAVGLQLNKKFIKNLQSKTVLLSPKTIPRKYLDKFMKVGLTDCIVEPIAPKSLLYKIKLHLKSLPVIKDDEDDVLTFKGEAPSKKNKSIKVKEEIKKCRARNNQRNKRK